MNQKSKPKKLAYGLYICRWKSGLTSVELAQAASFSAGYIKMVEQLRVVIPAKLLLTLSKVLKVFPDDILNENPLTARRKNSTWLHKFITANGFQKYACSRFFNIDGSRLYRMKKSKLLPPYSVLVRIADVFQLDIEHVLDSVLKDETLRLPKEQLETLDAVASCKKIRHQRNENYANGLQNLRAKLCLTVAQMAKDLSYSQAYIMNILAKHCAISEPVIYKIITVYNVTREEILDAPKIRHTCSKGSSDWFRKFVTANDVKIPKLASNLYCAVPYLYNIKNKLQPISRKFVQKLANYYGIDPLELLDSIRNNTTYILHGRVRDDEKLVQLKTKLIELENCVDTIKTCITETKEQIQQYAQVKRQ